MSEFTARFALPLLQAGQAQKEVYHNEALVRLDAVLHPAVAELATGTPPAVPTDGGSWIVGDGATGAWTGHAGAVATWSGGGWRFVAPLAGMQVWLRNRRCWAWHDGVAWRDGAFPVGGLAVDGVQVVGTRGAAIAEPTSGSIVDAEARSTLANILKILREHGLIAT